MSLHGVLHSEAQGERYLHLRRSYC